MSLTNRLSVFFLAALAVVLCGFSVALWFLVRSHLYDQFDQRLHSTLNMLVAATEVHPNDVQWEPLERRIFVGENDALDQPRWTIHDLTGKLRDRSRNLEATSPHRGWHVLTRRMRAGQFTPEPLDDQESARRVESLVDTPLGMAAGVPLPDDRTFQSDGVVIAIAANEAPIVALLRWMATVVIGVSAGIWLSAAVWGRWLCRKALSPIQRMAKSARSIRRGKKSSQRLDVPATNDELEDLGSAFNELLTDLRESLERQQRFAGDASHQLRTPLTAMLTSVDVALRRPRAEVEYQRVLELVRRRGGQLQQIIESLLFLARAEGESALAAPERLDLNQLCQAKLNDWKDHPRALDIGFQSGPNRSTITTHAALLGQILDNLIDNACKYSQPGDAIVVSVEATATCVDVVISDRGIGIAPAELASVFDPFFRSKDARWRGTVGVGLGLSVAQRLAATLNGKIEVKSELGQGSQFSLSLPADSPTPTTQEGAFAETAEVGSDK